MIDNNPTSALSRRSFLGKSAAAVGAVGAGGWVLAGCGGGSSSKGSSKSGGGGGGGSTALTFLEPGDQPPGWQTVLSAVNKKLKKDKNLTFSVQWIGWSNYAQTELLKYTAGASFTGSLEATWLHIQKLAQDGSILPVETEITGGKYPNLQKLVNPKAISANSFDGHLWGVPETNNASTQLGFCIRQDLAAKYGMPDIEDYGDFEKFLYDVKQKNSSMIPYGQDNGYVTNALSLFNANHWGLPGDYLPIALPNVQALYAKTADVQNGHATVVPLWEVPDAMDTIKRIRKYYQDGILNHDILSVDKNTIYSLFGQGKYAAAIGATDGLTTTQYGAVRKNVHGADLALILPMGKNRTVKPFSAFVVANNLSVNKKMGQLTQVMELQDWLSIKENHDLLEYGIEGKDWKSGPNDSYTALSSYVFPGYSLTWRPGLERTSTEMVASDKKWFTWSQDYNNFQLDPTAGFTLNQVPLKSQLAQLKAAYTKSSLPLFAGMVDTNKGISQLKRDYANASLDKIITETQNQLNAFLKTRH